MKQKISITGEHDKDYQIGTVSNSDSVIPTGAAVVDYVAENAGGTAYTSYVARIVHDNSVPSITTTVLYNNTGKSFTNTRSGNATSSLTPNTAFSDVDKVFVLFGFLDSDGINISTYIDANYIEVYGLKATGTIGSEEAFRYFIEIRIYP